MGILGACSANRDFLTDNDAENLLILIIQNLCQSIQKLSTKEVKDYFSKTRTIQMEINDNVLEEKESYSLQSFNFFVNKLLNQGQPDLIKISSQLFPEFDDLFDTYIKDQPEYNITTFVIAFLNEPNKFLVAAEVIDQATSKVTLASLLDFIKAYVQESLETTSIRFVRLLEMLPINKVITGTSYVVDDALKIHAKDAEKVYRNSNYFEFISAHIRDIVKKHSPSTENSDESNIIISRRHLEILGREIPHLFNILDLRRDAWNKSKEIASY